MSKVESLSSRFNHTRELCWWKTSNNLCLLSIWLCLVAINELTAAAYLAIWRSASSLKMSLTNQRDLAVQVATWSKFLCKLIWLCWNEKLKFLSLSSRQGNSFAIVLCQASRLLLLSFQDPKHSIKVNPPLRNENLERRTLFIFYDFLIDLTDGSAKRVLLCVMKHVFTLEKRETKADRGFIMFGINYRIYELLSTSWFRFWDSISINEIILPPNGTPKYLKLFLCSKELGERRRKRKFPVGCGKVFNNLLNI